MGKHLLQMLFDAFRSVETVGKAFDNKDINSALKMHLLARYPKEISLACSWWNCHAECLSAW